MKILIVPATDTYIFPCDTSFYGDDINKFIPRNHDNTTPKEIEEKGMRFISDADALSRCMDYNTNLYPFFYVGTVQVVGVNADGSYTGLTYNQLNFAQEWIRRLKLLY